MKIRLNSINVRVFFEKNIEKKHLRRHDKDYYYCCKSDIPAFFIVFQWGRMLKSAMDK